MKQMHAEGKDMGFPARKGFHAAVLGLNLVVLFIATGANATPVGCGGFVEAGSALAKLQKSGPKLDLSQITVELRNEDGLVRDHTQCFPNGYYFLPVYDKGTFFLGLNSPNGWSFEPTQMKVEVDGTSCATIVDGKKVDLLNFAISGFAVSGKVRGGRLSSCPGDVAEGPAGVSVALLADEPSGQLIAEVATDKAGLYKFPNVLPGKYRVIASHPAWTVTGGPFEVEVGLDEAVVGSEFEVAGYDLSGSVFSEGNPVIGVDFYLYSSDAGSLPCPETVPGNVQVPGKSQKPACYSASDKDGKFHFSSLPCGVYTVVPVYRGEHTVFDVTPKEVTVKVGHRSSTVEKSFQVGGFSVGGRVVGTGGGVPGVEILVDGIPKAVTNADGQYKIDEVRSREYTISAEKKGYSFAPLERFRVLPSLAALPDITATAYTLCGTIQVKEAARFSVSRRVTLKGEGVSSQVKVSDATGAFCFLVPQGEYTVSPLVSREEASSGLLFSPAERTMVVKGPTDGADFEQARVKVSGLVKCIGDACSDLVTVTLRSQSASSADAPPRVSRLSVTSNLFRFDDVAPGKYTLEVSKEASSATLELAETCEGGREDQSCWVYQDEWCWARSKTELNVESSDISNVRFSQEGFHIRVKAAHPVVASVSHTTAQVKDLSIKKGWNEFCVPAAGEYKLSLRGQCVSFGSFDYTWSTAKAAALRWQVESYLVEGELHVDRRAFPDANEIADRISVDVYTKEGAMVNAWNKPHLPSLQKLAGAGDEVAVYNYSFWVDWQAELVIRPRHDGGLNIEDTPGGERGGAVKLSGVRGANQEAASEGEAQPATPEDYIMYGEEETFPPQIRVLFCPQAQLVKANVDGCQPPVLAFLGRPGKQIIGRIEPPIEGLSVTAYYETDSACSGAKAGELARTTLTRADGQYALSPLHPDATYRLEVSKTGFHFVPRTDNIYVAQQLARIVVNVVPGPGAEAALPPVLITVSGEDRFMRNQATDEKGSLVFGDLFPGSFFLRPMLKEYSFTPAAKAIDVRSGETAEISFEAKRVAYSVLGTVTLLAGKPLGGIQVEAKSLQASHFEETSTDEKGRYRLRGLLPNTTYTVAVSQKSGTSGSLPTIERASPKNRAVMVTGDDMGGVDFLVFEHLDGRTLTGSVVGPDIAKWQPHISVEVINELGQAVRALGLPVTRFFEFYGLPKGKFTVRLRFALSERMHSFKYSTPEPADLEAHVQAHVGSVNITVAERHEKQELSSTAVMPLVVAIALVAAFMSMNRIQDSLSWFMGGGASVAKDTSTNVAYSRLAPNPNGPGKRKSTRSGLTY